MNNIIIDIDGTLLDGSREINNSLEFLRYLAENDKNYLLATNSIKSHKVQVDRFKNLGITIPPGRIYSPIDSINQMISEEGYSKVMVVGSADEINQIEAATTTDNPELIILLDFEKNNSSYSDLQVIIDNADRSCEIVSASGSPFYLKNGKKQVDTGAFVALIESITGRSIKVLGKPSKEYFINAKSSLGTNEQVTIIGDDWETDITGGKSVGFKTIMIRSGKYTVGDETKADPDRIINNFNELIQDDV